MATRDEILSGAQAVRDIASGMCSAAGEALSRHGPDPTSPAILSAAFCMVIEDITSKIDPTFKRRLMMQLGTSD